MIRRLFLLICLLFFIQSNLLLAFYVNDKKLVFLPLMALVNPGEIKIIPIDTEKHVSSRHDLWRRKHYVNAVQPVNFSKLTELQKQRVRSEASRAFIKNEPIKWWDVFNCTKKVKMPEHKNINLCIFEIINYISLYAHNIVYIFRVDNKDKDLQVYVDALIRNEKIDYKAIKPEKLCTIMKLYILNHLNGILPVEIASILCRKFNKRSKLEYKALMAYLPYALSDNEASLLLRIFNLFKIIDKNKEKTKMSIDSLLSLFSLVMFPKESFKAFDDLDVVKSITKDIYNLDFNEIPFTMVPKIIKYI